MITRQKPVIPLYVESNALPARLDYGNLLPLAFFDKNKMRGLVKAFLFFGAVNPEQINRAGTPYGSPIGATTKSSVPLASIAWNTRWNFTAASSHYCSVESSCGLAGSVQGTVIYCGFFGTTSDIFATAGALTGDLRFGLGINKPTPTFIALAQGTTAYGSVAATTDNAAVAAVFNGNGTGNAERLKLYSVSAGFNKPVVQKTLTYTGTVPATLSTGLTRLDYGRQWVNAVATYGDSGCYWALFFNRALTPTELAPLMQNPNWYSARQIAPYMCNTNSHALPLNFFKPAAAVTAGGGGFRRLLPRLVGIGGNN